MNKQELIKRFEDMPYVSVVQMGKKSFINMIEKLDEPQKTVVPQFVADYIKYAIENDWDFQDLFKCIEDEEERSDTWSRNYCDCACDAACDAADERGRRKSDSGYAGWENLWNVFLVEGSDHRSKGWRFL